MKIVDTIFLIDLSRNDRDAVSKAFDLDKYPAVFCTEISVYEIVMGVYAIKGIDHIKKLEKLEDMFRRFRLLALDHPSSIKSAEIAGELMRGGKIISDTDCMIAGIALSNGISTIVTRDKEHFSRIKGIKVESY